MIKIRLSKERGHFNHGWLDTFHTFSFGEYFDPSMMGFRSLRVINEDIILPAVGFGTHPHRDMEIITYVTEGSLSHKDSMGNGSTISAGEVQYMSAGTGITHSEFNASQTERIKLLQIWIMPDKAGYTPAYDQKAFSAESRKNKLKLIASQTGESESIAIRQNMKLYACLLSHQQKIEHKSNFAFQWIQLIRGELNINGLTLSAGDGAAIIDDYSLKIETTGTLEKDCEFLLFELS